MAAVDVRPADLAVVGTVAGLVVAGALADGGPTDAELQSSV